MASDTIQPCWDTALARAAEHAPFLARAIERLPELAAMLAAGQAEAALTTAGRAGEGVDDLGVALRRERLALALVLGIGDLAGAFPLARVMTELSAFADRALDVAIAEAVTHRVPDSTPAGFLAIALGKHGAQELNYSSDIDPILLFDPDCLPRRPRDEPAEAAQRIARRVVETLSRQDAEGYVFRVDLRLRPASEVSPLALSLDAAVGHYESSALAWERAAYIRARAAAGDCAAGERFLETIRPFVWRRSLDFGAIDEIASLARQIRAANKGTAGPGPGFNVKIGRGGIREVEFFAQTHQLIHGGREPLLRVRGTRAALDALAIAGIIATEDARVLGDAYDRLRVIEHRLQMVADQQTHTLPRELAALDQVARLDGLDDGAALVAELETLTATVGRRFDALIAPRDTVIAVRAGADQGSTDHETARTIDPQLAERIAGWRGGRLRVLRSPAAQAAFDRVLPDLTAALAAAPDPAAATARWESLLERLPSAINIFRLLEARPALLGLVARLLSLAPTLADELARRGDLLDTLIDRTAFEAPPDTAQLRREFGRRERGDDYQRVLDAVRLRVGERRFALGAQLIEGARDPIAVSVGLARVAEAALAVLAEATIGEFTAAHGHVPGSDLAILGLGRLGGAALTHASDLDLVFVFSGDHGAESNGARPLGATLYFNRLAQRIVGALSVPTPAGSLYQIDTRLRPSGAQGPLAVTLDSFLRYQREAAWTWEHMALTRARPVFGTPALRARLAEGIATVLAVRRDPAKLRRDVLEMRARMAASKPPKGEMDAKLVRGGLVDLEFIVHFHQLRDGIGLSPSLPEAIAALIAAGAVAPDLAEAHDALSRLLIVQRLVAPDDAVPPPAARSVVARALGLGDWAAAAERFALARAAVARQWQASFGESLEG